ncbi:hydantoinase/oxoprolinase family protein [Rhodoligotrophos appendicifer]|uniref:hydantoinase/oxoprolinase family protein n=1 Tax=Rhodoligotrophos appendicifer TaxID=987056 RepID=UPI00117D5658|nr:hydantoinase/oxoprolinase family protein [Rhodoligotrophos appendicifer]
MLKTARDAKVGADIGGTFTDIALEVDGTLHSTKLLTTHGAPEQAIIKGVVAVAEMAGIDLKRISMVIHGTTLATNALIERRGAKTAFITTKGFRDVIEMRTENRFEQYDLNITLPPPLVSRDHRYVVAERVGAEGQVLLPMDDGDAELLADHIIKERYQSVAIGLMHAYANGSHERRIREIIRARDPEIAISISSEVSPQMREFERFNTVCANAYVKPLMASYLNRLVGGLEEAGVDAPVYLIHSGGGIISVESAVEFPVRLLESGPAGGAIYAADVAARYGLKHVLSYDMGGTTAKICLIEDHNPKTAKTFEVARTYRFKKGSGMPISIPVIEMVEIGAGGGSIAHVDSMRQIRVGPQSAGSEPGPACYQRGGKLPTVTDADLLLGRLDPDHFAGGSIRLSRDESVDAISNEVANKLGMTDETAAVGICEVVDENMVNAARVHAVESGKDLAGFTMIAFGGAAPLHAARLCEKLGIERLLVPPGAGVGSAIGFLRAPFGFEAVRSAFMRLSDFDAAIVNQTIKELTETAESFVRVGVEDGAINREATVYMRYAGQGWEIPVSVPDQKFGPGDGALFKSLFEEAYTRLFGRPIGGLDVDIISWSLRASSVLPPPKPVSVTDASKQAESGASRHVFDAKTRGFVEAPIVARDALSAGMYVHGPAVIVENETTTIVTTDFDAIMQSDGCLLLRSKSSAASQGSL